VLHRKKTMNAMYSRVSVGRLLGMSGRLLQLQGPARLGRSHLLVRGE
jgi:hypothetical protein